MNTNSSLFLARDHAAELLGEADRERLARRVHEGESQEKESRRRSVARRSFFSLLRSPAGSR
jgi:hypothetical protein